MIILRGFEHPRAALLALCAALACASGERDAATPSTARAATVPAGPALQRGAILGGERARRAVVWPERTAVDRVVRERYPAKVREVIDRAPIPVLAPPEAAVDASATVGAHWYALTVHGDGYLLHTHGSGQARVFGHVRSSEPTHPMRAAGGYLTRNEDIWSASWIEHGVAYSFEIECDRRQVGWCDDEAEVMRRVESLAYVGGKEAVR